MIWMETTETSPATSRFKAFILSRAIGCHVWTTVVNERYAAPSIKGDQVSHKVVFFLHFVHAPQLQNTWRHTYIDQRITLAQDVDPARWGGTDLTQDLPRNQQWDEGKIRQALPPFRPYLGGKNQRFLYIFLLHHPWHILSLAGLETIDCFGTQCKLWSKLPFWLFVSPHFLAHGRLTGWPANPHCATQVNVHLAWSESECGGLGCQWEILACWSCW